MDLNICCDRLTKDIWADMVKMSVIKQWTRCPYCNSHDLTRSAGQEKICIGCGVSFITKRKDQKYHHPKCAITNRAKVRGKVHNGKLCQHCAEPLKGNQVKYCKQTCYHASQIGQTVQRTPNGKHCHYCHSPLVGKQRCFCNKTCQRNHNSHKDTPQIHPTKTCSCGEPLRKNQIAYCSWDCRNKYCNTTPCLLKDCKEPRTSKQFPWCCEAHREQYMKTNFNKDGESYEHNKTNHELYPRHGVHNQKHQGSNSAEARP